VVARAVDIFMFGCIICAKLFPEQAGGRPTVAFCAPSVKRCQSFCLRAVCLFFSAPWRSVREKTTKGALQTLSEMDRWKDYTIDFLAKHKLRSLLVSDSVLRLMRPALCPVA
jgi:hypothetical protein